MTGSGKVARLLCLTGLLLETEKNNPTPLSRREGMSERYPLWWIASRNGILVKIGRRKEDGVIIESGCPNLQPTHKAALELCRPGEAPVSVKIIRDSK